MARSPRTPKGTRRPQTVVDRYVPILGVLWSTEPNCPIAFLTLGAFVSGTVTITPIQYAKTLKGLPQKKVPRVWGQGAVNAHS